MKEASLSNTIYTTAGFDADHHFLGFTELANKYWGIKQVKTLPAA
jgi:hypothetical protein